MTPSSDIIEQKIAENTAVIFLLTGLMTQEGEEFYAYLAVRVDMVKDFMVVMKEGNGSVDVNHYGVILESGPGAHPPEDVKQKMTEEWNFNHDAPDVIEE